MSKIGDICPHCKEDKLVFINGNEPYNIDHLQCPSCDSTYVLEEKSNKVKVVTREVKEKELDLEYPIFLHFQDELWHEELIAILDEKCKITVKYDSFGVNISYETNFKLEEHYITNNTLTIESYFYEIYESAINTFKDKLYKV